MDRVVAYLLEKETISGAEMVAILEGRDPALADQYPDPDPRTEKHTPTVAHTPDGITEPIPLGSGEFGPEGKRDKPADWEEP